MSHIPTTFIPTTLHGLERFVMVGDGGSFETTDSMSRAP